jgi:hypothetical protein
LLSATKILKERGVSVAMVGNGNIQRRMTPTLLNKYDAVITIGKTVQYAIRSQVPVYCYDHFGGPGYLDQGNFSKASHLNFSGRGYKKKAAKLIARELIENYSLATEYAEYLAKNMGDEYSIESKIKIIQKRLEAKRTKKSIDSFDVVMTRSIYDAFLLLQEQLFHKKTSVDILTSASDQLRGDLRVTQQRLDNVVNSLSWKLTGPLRVINNGLRIIKKK